MDICHPTITTKENVEQSQPAGLVIHSLAFVSLPVYQLCIQLICQLLIAQICGTAPSVGGSTSTVVVTESQDGAFTVNTTITYTCPDNSTQTARCEYAPVGGAQWVGTLQDCPSIVGK